MVIITGYLDFPDLDHAEVVAGLANIIRLSRQDDGCIDYWWAEDTGHPARFRFFECWESQQHLADHRAQPFEDEFMANFVARCSGADAHVYEVSSRSSAV